MNNLNIKINKYGPINEANMEINKITVVGGVNGSGKSTVSKIFYSFLKANSTKRTDYALEAIINDMNAIVKDMDYDGNEYDLPKPLNRNCDYSSISNRYNTILELSREHFILGNKKLFEFNNKITNQIRGLYKKLVNDGIDVKNEIIEYNKKSEYKIDVFCENYIDYEMDIDVFKNAVHIISKIFSKKTIDENYKEATKIYHDCHEKSRKIFGNDMSRLYVLEKIIQDIVPDDLDNYKFPADTLDLSEEVKQYIMDFNAIQNLCDMWSYFINYNYFNCLSIENNLNIFFDKDSSNLSRYSFKEIFFKETLKNLIILDDKMYNREIVSKLDNFDYFFKNNFINFYINFNHSNMDAFDYFFNNDFIDSNIYYVDNVSVFDLRVGNDDFQYFFQPLLHMKELNEDLFSGSFYDEIKPNKNVVNILEKIENIIKGNYDNIGATFRQKLKYNKNLFPEVLDGDKYYIKSSNQDTPSGIKQIGIIQLLLLKNKLKNGSYLIIDEPEINLHPDWQFKFAEILVLLSKELDIKIYINSHSPVFIESIDAFIEFYDMEADVNYYLTEELDDENKYDFTKIESNELYKIYSNLGNAYKLIDKLRIKKRLRRQSDV